MRPSEKTAKLKVIKKEDEKFLQEYFSHRFDILARIHERGVVKYNEFDALVKYAGGKVDDKTSGSSTTYTLPNYHLEAKFEDIKIHRQHGDSDADVIEGGRLQEIRKALEQTGLSVQHIWPDQFPTKKFAEDAKAEAVRIIWPKPIKRASNDIYYMFSEEELVGSKISDALKAELVFDKGKCFIPKNYICQDDDNVVKELVTLGIPTDFLNQVRNFYGINEPLEVSSSMGCQ